MSVVDIIKEWLQVIEFFMEHLNNFNIIVGIQNFTAIIKSKEILLPVQQIKSVKCVVTVILCVALDIEMKIICPK